MQNNLIEISENFSLGCSVYMSSRFRLVLAGKQREFAEKSTDSCSILWDPLAEIIDLGRNQVYSSSLSWFDLSQSTATTLVEKYGTYTTVYGQIRAVYAPYFYRNPGRCFTTVCNENTACIRPYTAQNAM